MPIGLKNTPQTPLVDAARRITREWLQAFLVGGSWFVDIDLGTDVTGTLGVGHGGTGRGSLTAHDVLVGNGTGVVGLIPPGAAGTVLTSNGATADPSFQAVASGSGSWIPLVSGAEPPALVSDGAGALIVVAYA